MLQEQLNQMVVSETISWIGTPYRHQESVKHIGCDCLGLIRGIWRFLYQEEPQALPTYSPDWADNGDPFILSNAANKYLKPIERAVPGSVLLFRLSPTQPPRHCGILISKTCFVHAYWNREVSNSAFGKWWRRRHCGSFLFPQKG